MPKRDNFMKFSITLLMVLSNWDVSMVWNNTYMLQHINQIIEAVINTSLIGLVFIRL